MQLSWVIITLNGIHFTGLTLFGLLAKTKIKGWPFNRSKIVGFTRLEQMTQF